MKWGYSRAPMSHLRAVQSACLAATMLAGAACGPRSVPSPKAATEAYRRAVEAGDNQALYAMLSERAKRDLSPDEVRGHVAAQRNELAQRAAALAGPAAETTASARMRFADGEEAELSLEEGHFAVASSGALPGGASTPAQALDQLRRVLARRSYAGLMRIVTPETRAAIERDVRSLVDGLERPETLPVDLQGDVARVAVPGGHQVRLKREGSLWRVDDFD